ncbi:hypothetical protein HWV62_9621 [Athelia sp. TMB]|nr:hypothetical protein HWV62_9621 [Athelia sp. TMB]
MWANGNFALIEIPVGFSMASSCVMGSRLVLNVRKMKRQIELGISDRDESVLHIPFYSRQDAVSSPVMFARPSAVGWATHTAPPTDCIEMRSGGGGMDTVKITSVSGGQLSICS